MVSEDKLDIWLTVKTGHRLSEIRKLPSYEKDHFIADHLLPYICGDGTAEEEELAEGIIDAVTPKGKLI